MSVMLFGQCSVAQEFKCLHFCDVLRFSLILWRLLVVLISYKWFE